MLTTMVGFQAAEIESKRPVPENAVLGVVRSWA
jgi:hypothetical protein